MSTPTRPALASLLAAAILWAVPAPVAACTPTSSPDESVTRADVIVEGWMATATARPELPSGVHAAPWARDAGDPYVPVEVTVQVVHVLKGEVGPSITVPALALRAPGGDVRRRQDGSIDFLNDGGACAWPTEDPTGLYGLLVLQYGPDGQLGRTHPVTSQLYRSADDPLLSAYRERVTGLIPPESTARLTGGEERDAAPTPAAAVAAAALLTVLAGMALLLLVRIGRRATR